MHSQAVKVIGCLAAGFALGLAFPDNTIVLAIHESGTWFPRLVVTCATAIVFILMSAALANTLLTHARATRFLAILVMLYVAMAAVSLVYVSAWIPVLTGLPITRGDVPLPGLSGWLRGVATALSTAFTEQPLLQVLVAGIAAGAFTGSLAVLRPAAAGLMRAGDVILAGFTKLLWYYPIMIGCLAIAIPARFGIRGLSIYARTSVNLAIVALVWSAAMMALVRVVTRRSWSQLWTYFTAVYITGFGTGGSYDTLPVNLLSAERDLGLQPHIARVSIVLGTVLNKNVATMAVLLVTVATCRLLNLQISMVEIAVLVPPVMILGLESPGVPGGAGVFMSPVVASLVAAPDPALFVTTFVTLYSGLIPMLATAGNTTDDGFVGAIVNDCFMRDDTPLPTAAADQLDATPTTAFPSPVRAIGLVIGAAGLWMLLAPQAKLGLAALRWMSRTAFPGEAIAGALTLLVGLTMAAGATEADRLRL